MIQKRMGGGVAVKRDLSQGAGARSGLACRILTEGMSGRALGRSEGPHGGGVGPQMASPSRKAFE